MTNSERRSRFQKIQLRRTDAVKKGIPMKLTEFEKKLSDLINAEKFEEAEALLAEHVKELAPEDQIQPYSAAVTLKGLDFEDQLLEGVDLIGVVTKWARRIRNGQYKRMIAQHPNKLRILEEGDSWHQYPVFLRDVIDNVSRIFPTYSLSAPSDLASNMALASEHVDKIHELDPDIFMLSMGGNDLLGEGRFVKLLKPYQPGSTAKALLNENAFNSALKTVMDSYRDMVDSALATKPSLVVLVHGYDNALPQNNGKWLGKPLDKKGIPLGIGREIVELIVGRFNDALAAFASGFAGNVRYVDVRTSVGGNVSSWYDEIHPRNPGFERVANKVLLVLGNLGTRLSISGLAGHSASIPGFGTPQPEAIVSNALYDRLKQQSVPHPKNADAEFALCSENVAAAHADLKELEQEIHLPDDPELVRARQDYRLPNAASAYERVIGDRNLDEFYVLSRGALMGNAVARLFVRSPGFGSSFGTGFLIGGNLLLTNNHVLGDPSLARSSQVTFGHEFDIDGTLNEPATFRMTEEVFLTSVSHDYTIVSVEPTSSNGRSLSEFGHIEMLPRSGKALKREYVNIIQHPRGDLKKVALRENLVLGRRRQFLYYVTDTEPGSSGAPVFNEEFQLVALHHMAVPDPANPGQFVANRGIRVSEILKDILNKRNVGSAMAAEVDQVLLQARNGSDPLPLNAPVSAASIGPLTPAERMDEDAWMENIDTTILLPSAFETQVARPKLSAHDAYWPSSPRNAPDTWHLPEEFADHPFELTLATLKGLAEINGFAPVTDGHNKLIFGLRGCKLRNGGSRLEGVTEAQLQPISPDHENFRCVIGVADVVTGVLSLYSASTVPRRTQMLKYYNRVNFGTSKVLCNMLPTGCYEYCVGSHFSTVNGEVKFVLRQGNGPLPVNSSTVTTLRTHNDLAYGTQDYWDRTKPGDNIHPAFLSVSFSSQGCLTLPGTQHGSGSSHTTGTGEWRRFRKAAGFDGERHGSRYDVMLLTGHEAAAYSLTNPVDWPRLACLRHGSQGEVVAKLQQQIDALSDGKFGPRTKELLASAQNDTIGFATGTWTPDMAELMNLDF